MDKKRNASEKNSKLFGLLGIVYIILFSSCNKKPTADFTTDKLVYSAGDVIYFTNKSTDAYSYKWTFYDGQTSTSKDVNYLINNNAASNTYQFRLEAYSKKGNKTSEITKNYTVNAATGRLLIWSSNINATLIYVTVDNALTGTITSFTQSNPGCGAIGCVNVGLSVGSHSISATDGFLTWSGTTTIIKDNCTSFELP